MFKKRNVKHSGQNKRKSDTSCLSKDEDQDEVHELELIMPVNKKPKLPRLPQVEMDATFSDVKRFKIDKYSLKEKQQELRELERRKAERKELENEIEVKLNKDASKPDFVKPVSKNIKTKIVTDYQPDVCKDFKKTGYCGYGDSCKFLHSRDDFAGGWKLNQDWKVKDNEKEKVLKELEEIPFKCVLCGEDYKSPVVTTCGHYFCSSCFMKKMKESKACPVCGENTEGVAMVAKKLREFMNSRQ